MKSTLALSAIALITTSCVPSNELPPVSSIRASAVEEGTLTNHALAQDASLAIRKAMGGRNAPITKFVIQKPVGAPGRKAWREFWVYDIDSKSPREFIMTFREDGQGSANFQIQGK